MRPFRFLFQHCPLLLAALAALPTFAAGPPPQGPTAIVTEVYRNPLALPVLGTRAFLPYGWVAPTGPDSGNPRGIAPGRETAASDTFDTLTDRDNFQIEIADGTLAPGAFDAFRLMTRGYAFVDYAFWELTTADGVTELELNDPNVLTNLLEQSFIGVDLRTPRYSLNAPSHLLPGDFELIVEDLEIWFGLPASHFTLDDFLADLPPPDYVQALLSLPANDRFELESPGHQRRSTYSLATLGKVVARNTQTGEEIDFGPVAFAQTPRGLPEPASLALVGIGLASGLAARRAQRTKWRG